MANESINLVPNICNDPSNSVEENDYGLEVMARSFYLQILSKQFTTYLIFVTFSARTTLSVGSIFSRSLIV